MTDDEIKIWQLHIDQDKLKIERQKVWSSALSTAVPILVTALIIWSGFRSLNETAKNEFARQVTQIALDSAGPNEGLRKAQFLESLFGSELPAHFAQNFDKASKLVPTMTGPDLQIVRELLKSLADHPEQRTQILTDWRALFPNDVPLK